MQCVNTMKPIDNYRNLVYTMYIPRRRGKLITNIQKWGNSHGIRIPKAILDSVQWDENEKILINVKEGKIILEKAEKKKNIRELFENYNGKYEPIEMDWGKPVGDEIW